VSGESASKQQVVDKQQMTTFSSTHHAYFINDKSVEKGNTFI